VLPGERRLAELQREGRRRLQDLLVTADEVRPPGRGPLLVAVLRRRLAGPPRQRRTAGREPGARLPGGRVLAGQGRRGGELLGVHRARPGQRVPAGGRRDPRAVADRTAHAGDQHAEVPGRVGRRLVAPERVDEPVLRDDRPPPHRQHPHEPARLATAERRRRDLRAAAQHGEAAQEPDLEGVAHGLDCGLAGGRKETAIAAA
jgi:hypothetical protein